MTDHGMLARWDHAKWLQDRLGEARAENAALTSECERLRATLAVADEALMRVWADVTGLMMSGWDSERRRLGEEALVRLTAARAALGEADDPCVAAGRHICGPVLGEADND